jgi:hypothetical protein
LGLRAELAEVVTIGGDTIITDSDSLSLDPAIEGIDGTFIASGFTGTFAKMGAEVCGTPEVVIVVIRRFDDHTVETFTFRLAAPACCPAPDVGLPIPLCATELRGEAAPSLRFTAKTSGGNTI